MGPHGAWCRLLLAALVLGAAPRSQDPPDHPPTEAPPHRVVAVRAGTVHPVAGAPIQDGVVVIEDGRITAIGAAADVTIPAGAVVLDHRDAHVYPGLVDALTDAYTDQGVREDGSLDAAAALKDALAERGDREDDLVRDGITTAYVAAHTSAAWRGQGAVVHPLADGFEIADGKAAAAVELRATNGPQPSHALQRQQQVQGLFAAFEGLEQYRTTLAEHEKALATYATKFAEYLAFHEAKKGTPAGDGAARSRADGANPAERAPAGPGGRRRRGEGRGDGRGTPPPQPGPEPAPKPPQPTPPPQPEPGKEPAPKPETKGQEPQGQAPAKPGDGTPPAAPAEPKAPERPKYPKAPPRDPVKDALLDVLDGKLPLRVEVHRADEILAVLQQVDERNVPLVVLENPVGAAPLADRLATAGVPVVLSLVWPRPMPAAYEDMDPVALPAELERHGVAFALASGSARRSGALPLMAACAIGAGLPEAAALRAITLTPAEILGVQRDVGSLQVGKRGDVLVTDRPLFASDCKVLRVLSGGETQFEAR